MDKIFLEIVNNSLTTGLLILVVIAVRFLLKKSPKWVHCLLWGLVAVRLINPVLQNHFAPTQIAGFDTKSLQTPLEKWISFLSRIWITGVILMLFYAMISFLMLKRRVRKATAVNFGGMLYYESNQIVTPFLLGIIRPKIYMPAKMEERAREFVLLHEKTHISRGDHIWKPLGFLILSLYWFHPLCILAYILFCRDMEYACDEKATGNRDKNWKADYCQTLLNYSIEKRHIAACPVAFGEVSVKNRIKHILKNRKPVLGMLALGVVACIIVAVCFLTNPKKEMGVDSDGNSGNKDVVESFIRDELEEPKKDNLEEPEKAGTEESDTEESKPEEGDLMPEYSPFGQMGEVGPHYEYGVYPEKYLAETVLYETMADINHDQIQDYIKVVCYNDKVGSTYRETVELSAIGCYVMVYKGIADGICERNPMFISRNFHLSHAGNGVVCLSKYNGSDYLLFANIYEMQGDAYYDYAMVYLDEEKGILTADSDAVQFAVWSDIHSDWDKLTHREDVIPEFKKKMEPYLEDSEILMCLTLDEELRSNIIYFSTKEERIPANTFFDIVWTWTH